MKRFIAVTAIAGALAVGSIALAGPGPGLPGYGERVIDSTSKSSTRSDGRSDAPYALTGASQRARKDASGPTLVQHYGRGGQKAGTDPRSDSSSD